MAGTAPTGPNVGSVSSAYTAMQADWRMISDILDGVETIRAARDLYLPRYEAESDSEYNRRLAAAPWRPEFTDALAGISAKPFSKAVAVQGQTSERLRAFCEDVDTLGNNLHVYAQRLFNGGVSYGYHGIFVDKQKADPNATQAEEKALGLRPYWVHVHPEDLLAVYTDLVGGRTVVTHVRMREISVERDGYVEKTITRVRVLEPGRWELHELQDNGAWAVVDSGTHSLAEVPLVLFVPGKRKGDVVRPPLKDLAALQIELYRALARQEEILTFAGYPMLCAAGMLPPPRDVETGLAPAIAVGPGRILYAPPASPGNGSPAWSFVEPDADNIREVAAHVRSIIEDMRRLGMQPITQRSGTITATATATESAKAHSVVESWAMALKDAIEQALKFTAQFYAEEPTAEVFVHTDFGVDIEGSADVDGLLKARTAGEISRETLWDELLRRGKLGPQFDPKRESERLDDESVGRSRVIEDA